MIKAPEPLLYIIVLLAGCVYALSYYFKVKKAPSLVSSISVITATVAICKGAELVFNIIFNISLDIGQLNDSKLVIILGGFAVTWVGLSSCIGKFLKMGDDD